MTYRKLPTSRPAYSYDPATRELIGTIEVFLSPMEGTYPLPPSTMDFAPEGSAALFQRFRLTESLDAWEIVPDYRNVMLYAKDTARPVPNVLGLGDRLPDGVTTSQPIAFTVTDYKRNQWDEAANCWRAVHDYSQHALWEKATAMPVDPLPVGDPLPPELTTVAPPRGSHLKATWDEDARRWAVIKNSPST